MYNKYVCDVYVFNDFVIIRAIFFHEKRIFLYVYILKKYNI